MRYEVGLLFRTGFDSGYPHTFVIESNSLAVSSAEAVTAMAEAVAADLNAREVNGFPGQSGTWEVNYIDALDQRTRLVGE